MRPEQVAQLLVCGTLDHQGEAQMHDADFRAEVEGLLGKVGLELASGTGRWFARPSGSIRSDVPGFRAYHHLNQPHLAMLACVWLHLRYLPRQAGEQPADDATVSFSQLHASFYRSWQKRVVLGWVSELRKAGFLAGEGEQIAAGPLLAAIDESVADERADRAVGMLHMRRTVLEDPDAEG